PGGVDRFGPMAAAEDRRRNFTEAAARAFLGDGSAWIWGQHRRYFPTFVAIVDFLHALAHLFTAARAMVADTAGRWELFAAWAEACWKGRVDQVIAELGTWCEIQAGLCGGGREGPGGEEARRGWPTRIRGGSWRGCWATWKRTGSGWTTRAIVARACRGRPATWSRP